MMLGLSYHPFSVEHTLSLLLLSPPHRLNRTCIYRCGVPRLVYLPYSPLRK
ncbi:hypothetical protein HETIRDRAFT_163642 [Heterobasidion irregulare TC 32-1]|uniref:Uncharacterized protein n=1 Tax=Heterobasidion irregulare (strain TC 32-1) TaxID=747525 RepID=W4KBX3_HETIT|nr:uncharacterized protein HETIRDRAFT_163642 [Heterobasidion irregulare TC 32-1]ETW83244.1 hypothetical protein HETIRDRAFT_163642 [Heterobasidion irregulare TC 32-1]